MTPRVLVVEDDVHTMALIRASLKRSGFSILPATNGRAVAQHFKKSDFSAAIVDLMLPDGSGKDVLNRIRNNESTRSVPVLILTAKAHPESRQELMSLGADDYMTKPFSPAELVMRLKRLINQQ